MQGVNRLNQAQCGKNVTSIVKQNEQLTGFTQLLEVVVASTGQLEGFTGELQHSLGRVGRLEEVVGWSRPVQP